jgi:hypothetical protein
MLPWREAPLGVRMLRLAGIACLVAFLVALLVTAQIDRASLRQPTEPDDDFPYPHEVRGVTRYFTEQQDDLYVIAEPALYVSLALGVVLVGGHALLDRRARGRAARLSRR